MWVFDWQYLNAYAPHYFRFETTSLPTALNILSFYLNHVSHYSRTISAKHLNAPRMGGINCMIIWLMTTADGVRKGRGGVSKETVSPTGERNSTKIDLNLWKGDWSWRSRVRITRLAQIWPEIYIWTSGDQYCSLVSNVLRALLLPRKTVWFWCKAASNFRML